MIFQSGNWVNGYTHDELHNVYAEIVTYFTEEVFEKYDKPVAYKNQNI